MKDFNVAVSGHKFYNWMYGQNPSPNKKRLKEDHRFQWQGEIGVVLASVWLNTFETTKRALGLSDLDWNSELKSHFFL